MRIVSLPRKSIKVEVAIHEAFNQLELDSPAIIKEKVNGILNEEKSFRLTVAEVYQILIDEREKEIKKRLQLLNGAKEHSQSIGLCSAI